MEYIIERVKETSKHFEGIRGMEVLTYISPFTNEKRIDGPVNRCDYDTYYEWLREETGNHCISLSENLEHFKREFINDVAEFIPHVFYLDELDYLRNATKEDIDKYNSTFNDYFKEVMMELKH